MRYCMQDVRVLHALVVLSIQGRLRVRQRRAVNSAYACTGWTLAVSEDFASVHVRQATPTSEGALAVQPPEPVPRVSLSDVLAASEDSAQAQPREPVPRVSLGEVLALGH
jgi:hypothetical protein